MLEIGSFIELDLRNTGEYYCGDNIARLNTARAGIYHCLRLLNCTSIYLPYYECFTVRDFLLCKGIKINYYKITENFEPQICDVEKNAAILFVNYFGVMGIDRMKQISSNYKNVIIDNSQAFFSEPLEHCFNVYSTRKFFGVPDGCYVIGAKAALLLEEYKQDFSASTAIFLLERIEIGCKNAYASRMKNEERIDKSDIMRMSKLTLALLMNVPYEEIKNKRIRNFMLAHSLFKDYNLIDPTMFFDERCVPLVYPLIIECNNIVEVLIENHIYTGRWWNYLLNETKQDSFEYKLSSYMVPLPIDQRYDFLEINHIYSTIKSFLR